MGIDTRFRLALALLCAAAFISLTAQGQAQLSRQVLHNHIRREVSSGQAALVGRLPTAQRMRLSIVLPLRNQTALTELIGRLYDPSSPDFHHFLRVDQFTQQFGPTAEDYETVVGFAKANGFNVTGTPANRLIVPISGTAAQVEKAFNVRMNNYRHPTENRVFFSPDREPSLNLGVPVAHIAGLNNFSIPRPALTRASGANVTSAVTGSGPGGYFLPSDMRAAYYGSGDLNGSGQSIGLFELNGGYSISDVTGSFDGTASSIANGGNYVLAYTPNAGGTTYNVPINNVLLDNATAATYSGDDAEQVLDIVQAIGMAPGLAQVRVYIGASDPEILNSMATEDICKQISISWLWSPDDPSTDDPIFQEFAAQGQSVFAASGDFGGYNPGDTVYPAEDAYVTSVGGTDLVTNGAGGSWGLESAWISGGGGVSLDSIPIPNWQAGVANSSNQGSTTLRNVPDVAMEANTDNFLCAAPFGCVEGIGGTSASTPRWAAFMALVDQQAEAGNNSDLGFINPAVYSIGESSNYSSDFHDISTGNNNCCESALYYNAVTGYDLVTGWGSPDGQNLIDALAGPLSNPVMTISASPNFLTTFPGASGTSTILVNSLGGFSGSANLAVSGLPNGVTAAFSTNPAAGSSVLTITAATSATPGNYPLTITGTAGNLTSIASLALTIDSPGFTLLTSSGTVQISPSTPGTNTVTITPLGDFSGVVNLTASGLPSGVTASFSPNPATGSSVLTLTATISATTGTTTVTITGTSGAASASTSFVLVTNPATTIPPEGNATSSLNFGPVNIGTTSTAIPLNFTFNTNATVGSTSVLTQGATGLDFANAASGSCTANLTISAGGSCTVNVTFAPRMSGTRNGSVVIEDGSGNVIATGYVQGEGMGPQVTFQPGTESTVASSNTGVSYYGIAVDGGGSVYIADMINNVIWKETPSAGGYLQSTVQSSALANPEDVAVDGSGNVYIADTNNNRVLKETLSTGGWYSESVIASSTPDAVVLARAVAVGGNGQVYIASGAWFNGDTLQPGVLYVETPTAGGYTQSIIPTPGVNMVNGVAVDGNGNVYIAQDDAAIAPPPSNANYRVLKETLSGGSYSQSVVPTIGLGNPTGIAVDQAGNILIVDAINNIVIKETLTGGTYTQSTLATGSLNTPTTVAVDLSGNVYISVFYLPNRVVKLDLADPPSLTFANTTFGATSSDSPQTITAENVGNAALSFSAVSYPSSFPEGSPETTDCTATTSLPANQACTLTIDFSPLAVGAIAESLVLTDNALNQSSSTQVVSLSGTGTPPPGFTLGATPGALTVLQGGTSSESTIAVNDVSGFAGNVTLVVSGLPSGVTASFNPNPTAGTSVLTLTASNAASLGSTTFTITGTSGSFTASTSIVLTVTPVELIGTQSPAIPVTVTFSTAGTLSSTAVLTQGATGLDFANAGAGTCTVNTAYTAGQTCTVNVTFKPRFAGTREGAVVLKDGSGNVLATSYLQGTGMGPQINFLPNAEIVVANASAGLAAPYAMAVDGSGNIYVADVGANAVFKETLSAGTYTDSILPTSSLNQPTGIAVDGGGNVYIADTNNSRVLRESPFGGGYIESVVANSANNGVNFPIDLAVDGNGSVYFFCSSTLYIEAPSAGGYIQGTVPYSGVSSPGGLAADGSGNVYIVDFGNNQVVKETPTNSGYIQTTVPTSGLFQPSGIAVDGMGNIYVADIGGGPIFKETLVAGNYIQSIIATSPLNEPLAVTADQAGNVYIGDAGTALVLKEDFADAPNLAFASTASGAISSDSPQTVTVENAGNLALNFPIPSTGSNPSISTNFTLNSAVSGACPLLKSGSSTVGTLAAGASCQLPISFAPTALGTFTGSLALTDNNLNAAAPGYAVQTVNLSGTGTQIAPMITWATPSPITYGTALSKTQLDAKSSVAGSFSYSPASGTVLGAGQQTLTVTFTPTNTTQYATATATVTLTVNQATPAITWATPKAITYGTALSGTQLDASTKVAGTFAYSPASGTVLNAGMQTLTATFTPTDAVDYATATAMVMLTVNKATLTITWPTPAAISYGTALTGTQLDATSTAPGTFVYSPAAGAVLSVGNHTLTVTLTPTIPTNYTTSTATAKVTLTVNKAIPPITWATHAAITYGTALSATQLDASSTLAGTFTYSPAAGTVLNAGSQTLSVTFTPFNSANYATATDTVTLTVNKATPAITWATPAAITYGTALSGTQLDASSTVAGTFAYSPAAGTILAVGSQTLSVTFTPFNATDYTTATGNTTLPVNKATPAITWATPKAITYGTALSATQLDASSTVAGTFAYSPATGTVLNAGSQTLTVSFTPSNTTDYTAAGGSVILTVNKATPTVMLTSSASSIVSGTSVIFTAKVAGSGVEPTGTVTFFDDTKQLGAGTLNGSGVATFATSTLAVGKQSITASYGGNTNYLTEASSVVIVTVSAH